MTVRKIHWDNLGKEVSDVWKRGWCNAEESVCRGIESVSRKMSRGGYGAGKDGKTRSST